MKDLVFLEKEALLDSWISIIATASSQNGSFLGNPKGALPIANRFYCFFSGAGTRKRSPVSLMMRWYQSLG